MNKTSIEWTHRPETGGASGGFTWNPIRARNKETGKVGTFCTHASPGCINCYAEAIGKRFGTGLAFNVPNLDKIEFFLSDKILCEPIQRQKPATIFVGDMFDLFHDAIPGEMIAEVLRIAWKLPRHTFQFLTKRADRMQRIVTAMLEKWGEVGERPRPHMWFGVSVEDKQRASERIPFLQATPAAIRFLSVEPQLEEINPDLRGIDWVICGGESGNGARDFYLAWARILKEQCVTSNTAFFMKQVGSNPRDEVFGKWQTADSKGGNPNDWPESLRVRQFPSEKLVPA